MENRDEIIFGAIIVIILILIYAYCEYLERKYDLLKETCEDGKTHDWKFENNRSGNTGDLGFGIKGFWNIDTYYCTKCYKRKEIEK